MPEWGFLEKKSYSPLYNMYCKRTFDTRIVFFPVQFSGQFVHVYIALKTKSSAINISKKINACSHKKIRYSKCT